MISEVEDMRPLLNGTPLESIKDEISKAKHKEKLFNNMYFGDGYEMSPEVAMSIAQKRWVDQRFNSVAKGSSLSESLALQVLSLYETDLRNRELVAEALDVIKDLTNSLQKLINK